jgi:hypothetical protein
MGFLNSLSRPAIAGDLSQQRDRMAPATRSGTGDLELTSIPFRNGASTTSGMRVSQATALQVTAVRRCTSIRSIDVEHPAAEQGRQKRSRHEP